MLGVCLAALSAASFAFNNAATRRGVLTGSVSQAMAITVPLGLPLFAIAILVSGNLDTLLGLPGTAIATMMVVGVLHFICGRYCNYRSVKALGANLSAPVIQTYLVGTLVLAVLVLGEALTPLRILGTILVVFGPALMRRGQAHATPDSDNGEIADKPAGEPGPPPFRPRYGEGYLFGLLAATCYGISPILIRTVVEGRGLGGSLAAGVISYGAATLAIGVINLWPGQFRHVRAMHPQSAKWFLFSGAFVFLSQMFLYMALALAPVAVVIPMLQLQLIFRYVFARILNPHHEVFGGQMVVATIASLIGALALSVDTPSLLALTPLPDWLDGFLRWRWP